MARAKQKNRQHLIDERGQALLRSQLPSHWTLRAYRPDYGLDYALEVFSPPDAHLNSETLGEHFFIQLKSQEKPAVKSLEVFDRFNIEKRPEKLHRDHPASTIETVAVSIETPELVTIERMGVGVPVLLVVADLERSQCYFVCLNDYIDKVLVPRHLEYETAASRTVHVPIQNVLDGPVGLTALRWYAKRPKLYAAFQRFVYQQVELEYEVHLTPKEEMAMHFAQRIIRYDFWRDVEMWEILGYYREALQRFLDGSDPFPSFRATTSTEDGVEAALRELGILQLWRGLSVLPRQYEEICREWFLPTSLGLAASYPYEA